MSKLYQILFPSLLSCVMKGVELKIQFAHLLSSDFFLINCYLTIWSIRKEQLCRLSHHIKMQCAWIITFFSIHWIYALFYMCYRKYSILYKSFSSMFHFIYLPYNITFVKFTNYKMYIFTVCTALKHSFFKLLHVHIIGVFDVNM